MMEEFPHGYFFWKKAQFDLGMNHNKSQVTIQYVFLLWKCFLKVRGKIDKIKYCESLQKVVWLVLDSGNS